MGPCPLQGKQASVHRFDDLKGYRIGNLEWASKAVQALEKAEGTRKVKWQGKYISDRELVKKLSAIGIPCSVDRIKQFRKNNKAKHPTLPRYGQPVRTAGRDRQRTDPQQEAGRTGAVQRPA